MISEQEFRDLWEAHKEKLIRISGCLPSQRINVYSENTVESQLDGILFDFDNYELDFLKKFIVGYLKMGGSKVYIILLR